MGYFSDLAIDGYPHREDHSLIPRRIALQWRLEDLRARLIELMERGADCRERVAEEGLRSVLPEDPSAVEDVRRAIALVQEDFWAECGFAVSFDKSAPEYEQTAPVCRHAA